MIRVPYRNHVVTLLRLGSHDCDTNMDNRVNYQRVVLLMQTNFHANDRRKCPSASRAVCVRYRGEGRRRDGEHMAQTPRAFVASLFFSCPPRSLKRILPSDLCEFGGEAGIFYVQLFSFKTLRFNWGTLQSTVRVDVAVYQMSSSFPNS